MSLKQHMLRQLSLDFLWRFISWRCSPAQDGQQSRIDADLPRSLPMLCFANHVANLAAVVSKQRLLKLASKQIESSGLRERDDVMLLMLEIVEDSLHCLEQLLNRRRQIPPRLDSILGA